MLGSHKSSCYLVFPKFYLEDIIKTSLQLWEHTVRRGNLSNDTRLLSLGIYLSPHTSA